MKRIPDEDWNKFSEYHKKISAIRDEAEAALKQCAETLTKLLDAANGIREEAEGVLFDCLSDSQSFMEGRSEKWQESDAGQEFSGWVDELVEAHSSFSWPGFHFEIDRETILSPLNDFLTKLEEMRQGPDE